MRSFTGQQYASDVVDLTEGSWRNCIFTDCILIMNKGGGHVEGCVMNGCELRGDGWPPAVISFGVEWGDRTTGRKSRPRLA